MASFNTLLGAGTSMLVLISGLTIPATADDNRPTPTPTPTPVLTLGRVSTPTAGQTPLPTPVASSGIVITDSNIASYAARGKINVSGGVASRDEAALPAPTPALGEALPGLEKEAEAIARAEDHLAEMRRQHLEKPSTARQRAVSAAERRVAELRRVYEDKKQQLNPSTPTPVADDEDERAQQLDEVENLRQRIASLEQRMADLRAAGAGLDADDAARNRSQINALEQTLGQLRNQLYRAEERLVNLNDEEAQGTEE
jgi:hypothetical protein